MDDKLIEDVQGAVVAMLRAYQLNDMDAFADVMVTCDGHTVAAIAIGMLDECGKHWLGDRWPDAIASWLPGRGFMV